ncbi:MAG: hypothetical protein H7067_04395 [Burkholderiales bacterium]|nr:hypothetical protein [Opitutaceae bacterium]
MLIDENFDKPTEIIFSYPPEPGVSANPPHGNFGAWTKGGVISIKYGDLLGTLGTGGMLCTVEKPATEFMQVSYQKVALPFSDPTHLGKKHWVGYQLEFDAKIPEGRFSPSTSDPWRQRNWRR